MGAAYEGANAGRPNLSIVFRSAGLGALIPDRAVHRWVLNPAGPGVVGPMDLGDVWWAVATGGPDDDRDADPVTIVRAMVGANISVEVLGTDPWQARSLLRHRLPARQALLAGDATHQNPPWGGHGFNTGVGDAVNLGWKLAAVLPGWAPAELLGTYESERRPVAADTIAHRRPERPHPGQRALLRGAHRQPRGISGRAPRGRGDGAADEAHRVPLSRPGARLRIRAPRGRADLGRLGFPAGRRRGQPAAAPLARARRLALRPPRPGVHGAGRGSGRRGARRRGANGAACPSPTSTPAWSTPARATAQTSCWSAPTSTSPGWAATSAHPRRKRSSTPYCTTACSPARPLPATDQINEELSDERYH